MKNEMRKAVLKEIWPIAWGIIQRMMNLLEDMAPATAQEIADSFSTEEGSREFINIHEIARVRRKLKKKRQPGLPFKG